MHSSRQLLISADDIGLSKGNTDTILEGVDAGVLTNVSILPNGPAFAYAVEELKKRLGTVRVCAHLNLTEGRPLSRVHEVSLLVRPDGTFKGTGALARLYMFGSKQKRAQLRTQIYQELSLQVRQVEAANLSNEGLWVDGHQHVHMLPFVFEEIVRLKEQLPIAHIRVPREPLHIHWPFSYSLKHVLTHTIGGGYVLALLGIYGRRLARSAGIATNDWFVGVRYAGRMTSAATESGLRAVVAERAGGETELLFHPGEAGSSETLDWSGDCAWHFSPWRTKERAYVVSESARTVCEEFRRGTLSSGPNLDKILRYVISGGLAACTHLGALFVFTDVFGIWFVTANVLAFCVGLIVSFGLQKLWTFGDLRRERAHHQAFWYALVQSISLGVDTVLLYLLVTYAGWWYLAAQFVLLILIAVGNFFVFNYVIFKNHGDS